MDAIIIISVVWKEVSSGCMNEMWQKLCPQHVHDIRGFSIEENMLLQQYIFLVIFVSCLFHFLLKNCCVICSVLYFIVSVLQFEALVTDRPPEHFIYFIWGNCSHFV